MAHEAVPDLQILILTDSVIFKIESEPRLLGTVADLGKHPLILRVKWE